MKAKLDTKVAFHFSGEPVGVKSGGVQQVELHELDIRTLPDKLTASFDVDISALDIGDQLLVSDLPKHEGWEVLTPEDTLIVRIAPPVAAETTEEDAAAEPAAVEASEEGKSEE